MLDAIFKQLKGKKIISSQHGPTKGKLCPTNLVDFCDVITIWIDEGRTVDVVHLDFRKAFDTISPSILVMKLRMRGINEWTVRWTDD